jgi:hypothetical protein
MDRETIEEHSELREMLEDYAVMVGVDLLLLDGFDEAFVGIGERCGQPELAVYSWEKMIDLLMERDGMNHDEAIEYISYNVTGGWVGEKTPIVVSVIDSVDNDYYHLNAAKAEIEGLRSTIKSLEKLQDMLVRELAAWVQSSPKLLRRWLISRMERERTVMRDL